jgi:hypothetical protein
MSVGRSLLTALLLTVVASGAAAQDRPAPVQDRRFLFSVSTLPDEHRRVTVRPDSGFGEREPDLHATRSGRASEATRGLPNSGSGNGYAVRAALSYGF